MTRLRADLLLLAAAVIWGLAFVFQKSAMAAIGPATFIAARGVVAVLALAPLAVIEWRWTWSASDRPLVPAGLWRAGIYAGVAFFGGAALQQYGLKTATATNGGFLTALYVVLTPPLAWLIRGARPGPVLIPAALLSAAGTWMLGGGSFAALSEGDWLVASCAAVWALHVILSESGSAFDRPVLFTCIQFGVVAMTAGSVAALTETPSLAGVMAARGEILYVGLLSSALTFTVLTLALRHTPASEAAVIVSTESLFAALAGAVLLGERLGVMSWAGAAMIMTAVLMVQIGPSMLRADAR